MGDKSAPRVSRGTQPRHRPCEGFTQTHRQNGLFLQPPALGVRVMAPFRNAARLLTRKSLPRESRQPCFSLHLSGGKNPLSVTARAVSMAVRGVRGGYLQRDQEPAELMPQAGCKGQR